jgi:hypothetical protein
VATKEDILKAISGKGGPVDRKDICKTLNEPTENIYGILKRLEGQKLVERNEDFEYWLTDGGQKELLDSTKFTPPGDVEGKSEEELGVTEYQKFMQLGQLTGIPSMNLIQQTADHVWRGGDYRDLVWIAQAFQQMDIRVDLARRWLHSWRTYLKQAIPANLPSDFMPVGAGADGKVPAGTRAYRLDERDIPQYIGEGLGDMDYKDAMELAKVRTSARARVHGDGDGAAVDDLSRMERIWKIFTEAHPNSGGKTWLIKPGEQGYQVEEAKQGEDGKPIVVSSNANTPSPAPSYMVHDDGKVEQLEPGKPVVIIKQPAATAPSPQQAVTRLVDSRTGAITEVAPNQPIIIVREVPAINTQQPLAPVLQAKDAQGNLMTIDMSTFFVLEEHKADMERKQESHKMKVELTKTVKDLLVQATTAFANMKK